MPREVGPKAASRVEEGIVPFWRSWRETVMGVGEMGGEDMAFFWEGWKEGWESWMCCVCRDVCDLEFWTAVEEDLVERPKCVFFVCRSVSEGRTRQGETVPLH